MVTFEIIPGIGIGPIKFGFTKEQVNRALGMEPVNELLRSSKNNDERGFYYPDGILMVSYSDKDSTIDFIEITNSAQIKLIYKGIDLFPIEMDNLAVLISKETPFDEDNQFSGYSYVFPALELALWREATPNDFIGDDEYQDEDWFKEDFEKSKYCTMICLRVKGYYSDNPVWRNPKIT